MHLTSSAQLRWRSLFFAPTFFASLFSLVGLGSALAEIRQHSYWPLGLPVNLKVTAWYHTTNWLVLGLCTGADNLSSRRPWVFGRG
jgi:hypothetical protein